MPEVVAEKPKVVDLMAALEASVRAAKDARSVTRRPRPSRSRRRPAPSRPRSARRRRRRPRPPSQGAGQGGARQEGGAEEEVGLSAARARPTMATADVEVEIEGRRLTLGNLDKVLYPSGFTKAQVIDYMARIAPYRDPAPHRSGADVPPLSRRHADAGLLREALSRATGPRGSTSRSDPGTGGAGSSTAASTRRRRWCGRPTWRRSRSTLRWRSRSTSTRRVRSCSTSIRARRRASSTAASSPAPRATCSPRSTSRAGARRRARRACRCTSRSTPRGRPTRPPPTSRSPSASCSNVSCTGRVTTVMAKNKRPGKIFVDWSQNAHHKTTIAPVFAARPRGADRLDAGRLGRGRGLRRRRARAAVHQRRRARTGGGHGRPVRTGADARAAVAGVGR